MVNTNKAMFLVVAAIKGQNLSVTPFETIKEAEEYKNKIEQYLETQPEESAVVIKAVGH